MCVTEQGKSTGSTGGGGAGGGWLWRISQGLKAGIQAERRCVCECVSGYVCAREWGWGGGAVHKSFRGGGGVGV